MSGVQVTIEGITFTIMGKIVKGSFLLGGNTYVSTYNQVHINSQTASEENDFVCYSSHSEVGMWRLSYFEENSYNKSIDYVQSTLIHLELQHVINMEFDSLRLINEDESYFHKLISEKKIKIKDEEHNGMPIKVIAGSLPITSAKFRQLTGASHAKMLPPFSSLSFVSVNCGITNLTESNINVVEYYKRLNVLLSNLYLCEEEIVHHRYSNLFEDVIRVEGEICSIRMNPKRNAEEFRKYLALRETRELFKNDNISPYVPITSVILYYLKCKVIGNEEISSETTYYMPILLQQVPVPNRDGKIPPSIDVYGLNTSYILAGAYVCKLFDYKEQCSLTEGAIVCTEKYNFIGSRYRLVYPFTELIQRELASMPLQELAIKAEEQKESITSTIEEIKDVLSSSTLSEPFVKESEREVEQIESAVKTEDISPRNKSEGVEIATELAEEESKLKSILEQTGSVSSTIEKTIPIEPTPTPKPKSIKRLTHKYQMVNEPVDDSISSRTRSKTKKSGGNKRRTKKYRRSKRSKRFTTKRRKRRNRH
jgi:hypothetical protein